MLGLTMPGVGLTRMGGVARAVAPARPLEGMASKGDTIYSLPDHPPRPFEADYPHGTPDHVPGSGRLKVDIDGTPIETGWNPAIAGRRVLGGADEAISPAESDAAGKSFTGLRPQAASSTTFGRKTSGAYIKEVAENPFDPYHPLAEFRRTSPFRDGYDRFIFYLNTLKPEQVPAIVLHELGHVMTDLAGSIRQRQSGSIKPKKGDHGEVPLDLIPPGNHKDTLAQLHRRTRGADPESFGYKKDDVLAEHWAEAFRAYMQNPGAFKAEYPELAAYMRQVWNSDLDRRRVLHLNSIGGTAASGATLGQFLDRPQDRTLPDDQWKF